MHLDETQQAAAAAGQGPALIAAGPGSGKTRVMIGRAANLVSEHRVSPERILIMTFTRAAAAEMSDRLERLLGGQARLMHIRTIHGFAYQLLRHIDGPFRLLDESGQRQSMGAIIRRLGMSEEMLEPMLRELSNAVNRGAAIDAYEPEGLQKADFAAAAAGYSEEKRRADKMDFDDLLVRAVQILESRPVRPGRYVMVDEFQDTSLLQYRMIRRLSAYEENLCVVGDDDQSIYGWRGADSMMQRFLEDYKQAAVWKLATNYRSTEQIVAVSQAMIRYNHDRLDKELSSWQTSHRGPGPTFVRPEDEKDEARWIRRRLEQERKQGTPWQRMAVIYRTNRQAVLLQQQLDAADISYRTLGGDSKLLQHWVCGDLQSYLRAAVDPGDGAAFFRILNRPGRYFSQGIVEQARRDMTERGLTPPEALRFRQLPPHLNRELAKLLTQLRRLQRLPAGRAVEHVRYEMGYDRFLRETCEHLGLDANAAIDAAHVMTQLAGAAEPIPEFLDRLDAPKPGAGQGNHSAGVTLTTCHSAKGLEFRVVIVAGVVEDLLPHEKALKGSVWSNIEEERRLMYVAITRCEEKLYISSPKTLRGGAADTSRFVGEMRRGVIVPDLEPGTAVMHPAWGCCRLVDTDGELVYLETPDGSRKRVLRSWLVERAAIG